VADPFTSASPTYIAAQRTNQAKGHGWCFDPVDAAPAWVRILDSLISAFAKPYVWVSLAILVGSLALLLNYGG
jgi:hypothetical protein